MRHREIRVAALDELGVKPRDVWLVNDNCAPQIPTDRGRGARGVDRDDRAGRRGDRQSDYPAPGARRLYRSSAVPMIRLSPMESSVRGPASSTPFTCTVDVAVPRMSNACPPG